MGGKTKTKKRVQPKKKIRAPKIFKCPFCAHEASCEVKLDRAVESGTISCRVCGEAFQTRISYLSDPVDVYCAWVDELQNGGGDDGPAGAGAGGAAGGSGAGGADAAGSVL